MECNDTGHTASTSTVTITMTVAGVYKELGTWMYDVLIDIRGIQSFYNLDVSATPFNGSTIIKTLSGF